MNDQPIRVLMVDDNAELINVVREAMDLLGVKVDGALSAQGAIAQLARDDGYDVVFSDVFMPNGMSGVQLLQMLAVSNPDMRTVLTSGFPKEQLPPLPEGVTFVAKPYNFTLLLEAFKREAGTSTH